MGRVFINVNTLIIIGDRCTYDTQYCSSDQGIILQDNSTKLALHEIQGFYNKATTVFLDQLSKEIQSTNGTKTWR